MSIKILDDIFVPESPKSINGKIRRICLYGGPSSGKSTNASELFSYLNKATDDNTSFELIQEYVKGWAWEDKKPQGFDQNYIFAKQQHREEIPLRNGAQAIVTDCPILLPVAYAKKNGVKSWQHLAGMAELHEEVYPGVHIFLDRGDMPFSQEGRLWGKDHATIMDDVIKNMLDLYIGKDNYTTIKSTNFEQICNYVVSSLYIDKKQEKKNILPFTPGNHYEGVDEFGGSDF